MDKKSGAERTGIYPGTFDPITKGHMDIVQRSLQLVDHLIVAVASNPGKKPLFSLEERLQIVQEELDALPEDMRCRVRVEGFQTLLINFAREKGAGVIIRGLRAVSDFEYEFQMAGMNARMRPDVETAFLMSSDSHQFISSGFVKEIGKLGGDISHFVSQNVAEHLTHRFDELAKTGN